jgi:hypothetical protein
MGRNKFIFHVYFPSQISFAFPFDTVMLDTGSTVGDSE